MKDDFKDNEFAEKSTEEIIISEAYINKINLVTVVIWGARYSFWIILITTINVETS